MKKTLLLAGVASVFAFNANAVELLPYVGLDYNYSMLNHDEAVVVGEDSDANLIKDGGYGRTSSFGICCFGY